VHSHRFNTHSEVFTCPQACSIAFNWIQYLLKGIHMHSRVFNRVQYLLKGVHVHSVHSIGFNTRSKAFTCTRLHSFVFNHIHTHSKAFMRTKFHVGISIKVYSVAFSLHNCVHAHSIAFNRVQFCSMLTQRRSHTLNRIQSHSILAQSPSRSLKHVQWWSHSRKGIQSGQTTKDPMQMCA